MPDVGLTRRGFAATLAAPLIASAAEEWISLFDGRTLKGWKANENASTWKVDDGALSCSGPRSHLFYTGATDFKNFELEAEVLASPRANSGIYFHTKFQSSGCLAKGFEVQVDNSALGEGDYRERKKTASLYGVRNVYRQFAGDNEWFKLNVLVRGKNVQIRLNGTLMVDYTEPAPVVFAKGVERDRRLDVGTFALQGHDAGSKARFRALRVRRLADDTPTPADAVAPVVDDLYRKILTLGAENYPMVDYHVHLKNGLTLEQALMRSRRDGINYGIAVNCGKGFPVQDDESLEKYVSSMRGQPCFIAMQAEGREWTQMFSRAAVEKFDYVFTDSMTWTDNHGRRMRTWMANEVGAITDPQEFMETLVERAVGIIENEPIDIYVNPTYLPDAISKDYDTLWTEARMKKVVGALKRAGVAMELNDRYSLPGVNFVRMAKAEGVKFTFGTNNAGPADLRRCQYGIRMIEECGLKWSDFWAPGAWGPRGVERKGKLLKS
jgi:hypothetical protein